LVSSPNNIPSTSSIHSSTISTEEMTVTPDMPISTSDAGSSLNLAEEEYFEVQPHVPTQTSLITPIAGPSGVTPQTGFHFLFSSEDTVDLTNKEDTTPKKLVEIKN